VIKVEFLYLYAKALKVFTYIQFKETIELERKELTVKFIYKNKITVKKNLKRIR